MSEPDPFKINEAVIDLWRCYIIERDMAKELEAENARLKAEVERLTEIIDSFKTMPIIEGQSFNGWKLDEHHRLVSLVEHLRAGSIEGAKQFTHKEYRDFQKTMIEKNAAKEGKGHA